jgi:UPF0271 protein
MTSAIEALGDGAIRLVRPSGISAHALFAMLRREPRVIDVVITEGHVALTFDPAAPPRDPALILAELTCVNEADFPVRAITRIAVRYDGIDLAEIAAGALLSVEEVIALHAARTYVVTMVGFLPGFAYLGEVDPRIAVPRRAEPRARIAASSVGIGGTYTGVYPFASPGGWNIIGTALDFSPFALTVDDRVEFHQA